MKIIFSYDCEGNWGCVDWKDPYLKDNKSQELAAAYNKICELHEKYNIPATFGFVGMYVIPPNERKEIIEKHYSSFLDKIPNLLSSGGCWEGIDNLKRVASNKTLFEVASHSLTHITFSELSDDLIEHEVKTSKEILTSKTGSEIKSFIYPRNMIKSPHIIEKSFKTFRRTSANTRYLRIKDLLRTIGGINFHPEKEVSDFIFWKGGARKNFSDSGWKKLWSKRLSKKGNSKLSEHTIHVWSHPHNFITDPTLTDRLEWLLKSLSENKQDNEFLTLSEI